MSRQKAPGWSASPHPVGPFIFFHIMIASGVISVGVDMAASIEAASRVRAFVVAAMVLPLRFKKDVFIYIRLG